MMEPSAVDRLGTTPWQRGLTAVFGCDPRSLALFRIGLGVMILLDIGLRWPYAEAFLTDGGVVDRPTATALLELDYGVAPASVVWSLNFLSGELWWQLVLLGALAAAATGLLLGWRTWWMTLACWVLIVSLHMRCPVILSSGDTLLRNVLFWSLFTPLGACWSLDARRHGGPAADESRRQPILTAGTVGLITQLVCMYFFAGIAKWNVHWWQGDAMEYVFRLDLYARPWAAFFLDYPLLLQLVTWGTLFAEIALILLLLLPWNNPWWRIVNFLTYVALHLSIAVTMEIGLFPYISLVAWLPLLPAGLYTWGRGSRTDDDWDWRPEVNAANLDTATAIATATRRDWRGGLWHLGQVFAAGMVGYVVLWNVANIPVTYYGDLQQRLQLDNTQFAQFKSARQPFSLAMPAGLRWLGPATGTGQHYQMFGVPPEFSPWFVYDATLEDGVRIDLMRVQAISYDRPTSTLASLPGHHWRKLHDNLLGYGLRDLQQRVARYKLAEWNKSHRQGKQVVALKVTCFAERTGPQYAGSPPDIWVWYDWRKPLQSLDDLQQLLERNPDLLPGF